MKEFKKVLVANRGEIAVRVIRSLREMGIRSVAVYSEIDRAAPHVVLADEAYPLGGATAAESYLDTRKLLSVAQAAGVDAVHPGYGFLSENPDFCRALEDAGITFIGPPPSAMESMGEKTRARRVMEAAGVPVVPGVQEPIEDGRTAAEIADEIGYPVLLKAAAGGGGKGMRAVHDPAEIVSAFEAAQREAVRAFGNGAVYLEKLIERPRHIEIQVLADHHGNIVHLFERECSVQRRHQKVIEETPAQNLPREVRDRMGEIACKAARAVGYRNAGTVEFLVDQDHNFYFLEMNTRLQVEHPITEMVTGIDLVNAMVRVAQGEPLWFSQSDLAQHGHAIEARIYAEDPANGFLPAPGPLDVYIPPAGPGIRMDDGVRQGLEVSRHYDPMIGKLVTWAGTRDQAIARMHAALEGFMIGPVRHNIDFLLQVLDEPDFAAGRYDTGILDRMKYEPRTDLNPEHAAAAVAAWVFSRPQRTAGGAQGVSRWKAAEMLHLAFSKKVG